MFRDWKKEEKNMLNYGSSTKKKEKQDHTET